MKKDLPKDLLIRGVSELVDPDGVFKDKLLKNPEKVVIKFGVDPTRPDLHLGHAVVLRKLREFQKLGCKVIFLVGDFTALIGDPTGKDKIRPEQDWQTVNQNMLTYLKEDQIGKLLNVEIDSEKGEVKATSNFDWIRNSDWFTGVTDIEPSNQENLIKVPDDYGNSITVKAGSFLGKSYLFENTRMQKFKLNRPKTETVSILNCLSVLRTISHARLIERDMFEKRTKKGEPLFMSEMLYPVFQGIDSVALHKIYGSCDLEVGGTDQTFNMLMGRDVMRVSNQQPQAVMSFEILEGLDGKEKMSKSLDNYIAINEEPNNMYGKVMSLPDNLIVKYFTLCTDVPTEEVKDIANNLVKGTLHPKEAKMRLAREIVTLYHGEKAARSAEESFVTTFSKGEVPTDAKKVAVTFNVPLVDILIQNGIVSSKSEFRRLVEEGAITLRGKLEEKKIIDPNSLADESGTLKVGKRRFLTIEVEKKQ